MNSTFRSALLAVISVGLVSFAQAQDAGKTPESHDHSATAAAGEKSAQMGGHMNMDEMHGMMQDCMKNHKDGKMCQHQTMEKCQANMGKADCQKMMKDVKAKKN